MPFLVSHSAEIPTNSVLAVIIPCRLDMSYTISHSFLPVYIPSDYSDFRRKRSLSVKSEPIGLPLVMSRLGTSLHNPEDLTNVIAEWLSKAADGRTLRNK